MDNITIIFTKYIAFWIPVAGFFIQNILWGFIFLISSESLMIFLNYIIFCLPLVAVYGFYQSGLLHKTNKSLGVFAFLLNTLWFLVFVFPFLFILAGVGA